MRTMGSVEWGICDTKRQDERTELCVEQYSTDGCDVRFRGSSMRHFALGSTMSLTGFSGLNRVLRLQ